MNRNFLKTVLLLTGLTFLFVTFGYLAGGRSGVYTALILTAVMNFFVYWQSDRIVLAMHRAEVIREEEAPELYEIVRRLADKAGMPAPRLYLISSASPNAFATGRDPQHAALAVTSGILELLSAEELEGVLAHELGHVKNRDILIATVAATLAGAVSALASMIRWGALIGGGQRRSEKTHPVVLIFLAFLMPVAAALIQLAVSRSREFHADDEGARLCGNPLYLASALGKLESGNRRYPMREADPSCAHLFIVNPLIPDLFARLFSTHPPIEERIARLDRLAREGYGL